VAEAAAIEGEIVAEAGKPPRFSKKQKIIAGVVLLLLLIGGGVAAWLLMGSNGEKPEAAAEAEKAAEHGGGEGEGEAAGEAYVEVPAMIVNLRSADGAPRLIKLRLMLVPANAAAGAGITARLPVIIDSFQPFLRELRPEDLAGSAAIFRIKEELLARANTATSPGSVKDVLIQDLIQQ
jgi:flagellar FliL protein